MQFLTFTSNDMLDGGFFFIQYYCFLYPAGQNRCSISEKRFLLKQLTTWSNLPRDLIQCYVTIPRITCDGLKRQLKDKSNVIR